MGAARLAEPVRADRIVIYDRPGTQDDVNGGELTFSDGGTRRR